MNSNGTSLSWPATILLGLATLVFGGGTMATIILGKTVPEALWAIDGSIITAMVGATGFFIQRQMHAASLWHLAQAAQGIPPSATATTITTTRETTSKES